MSKSQLPELYNQNDVDNARTKGQLIGWVQGAGAAVAGMLLLGVVGWIPTIAIVGVGGFAAYKLLSGLSKRGRS
ncbi:MAG TPA: hypothetical protein VGQ06_15795 [Gemmatimonadales bacterium]|jgi:hypothetical protein|nr:hypothetical protein [Gemmatimonadales bacterium]